MTGDGHWQDIVDGLEMQKLFDSDGNLHVNVLKIQHHGATGNMKPDFLKRVTADHYVFCGINKKHANPEKLVVEQVLDSRLKEAAKGTHAKVDDRFKLWFTGSSTSLDTESSSRQHIKTIENLVAARANPDRFEAFFLNNGPSFDVEI